MEIIVRRPKTSKLELFERFHGSRLSPREVERQKQLQGGYREDAKGRTKGTRRKYASIPPHIYHREQAKHGAEAMRNPEHLKRIIDEHGLKL